MSKTNQQQPPAHQILKEFQGPNIISEGQSYASYVSNVQNHGYSHHHGNLSFGDNGPTSFGSGWQGGVFGAGPSNAPIQPSYETALAIASLKVRLDRKLGPEYLSTRVGPAGGGKLTYVEGHKIINLANEVFGFNGWSSSIMRLDTDFVDFNPGTSKYSVCCSALVRITLRDGTWHEDIGMGQSEGMKSKASALEKCKKECVTDGIKRALRSFGNVMGNCLYDKDYTKEVAKIKVTVPKFDSKELYRRPEFDEFQSRVGVVSDPMGPHPQQPAEQKPIIVQPNQPRAPTTTTAIDSRPYPDSIPVQHIRPAPPTSPFNKPLVSMRDLAKLAKPEEIKRTTTADLFGDDDDEEFGDFNPDLGGFPGDGNGFINQDEAMELVGEHLDDSGIDLAEESFECAKKPDVAPRSAPRLTAAPLPYAQRVSSNHEHKHTTPNDISHIENVPVAPFSRPGYNSSETSTRHAPPPAMNQLQQPAPPTSTTVPPDNLSAPSAHWSVGGFRFPTNFPNIESDSKNSPITPQKSNASYSGHSRPAAHVPAPRQLPHRTAASGGSGPGISVNKGAEARARRFMEGLQDESGASIDNLHQSGCSGNGSWSSTGSGVDAYAPRGQKRSSKSFAFPNDDGNARQPLGELSADETFKRARSD